MARATRRKNLVNMLWMEYVVLGNETITVNKDADWCGGTRKIVIDVSL